jgi:hypothetical protein
LPGDGIDCRATSVPVFELMTTASATALGLSDELSVLVIVPVTVAVTPGPGGETVIPTSEVGPPVMTGTGSTLWRSVEPSVTDA